MIKNTAKLTSTGVYRWSPTVVWICKIGLATAFFGTLRYSTLKSNSWSLKRQRATFAVCDTPKRHFKGLWLMLIVKSVPCMYGRTNRTAQVMAKHSLSVFS